jgi:hypothetical protein
MIGNEHEVILDSIRGAKLVKYVPEGSYAFDMVGLPEGDFDDIVNVIVQTNKIMDICEGYLKRDTTLGSVVLMENKDRELVEGALHITTALFTSLNILEKPILAMFINMLSVDEAKDMIASNTITSINMSKVLLARCDTTLRVVNQVAHNIIALRASIPMAMLVQAHGLDDRW